MTRTDKGGARDACRLLGPNGCRGHRRLRRRLRGRWGATPGKRLLGLVIANPDGTPADRWRLFFRWSSKYYSVLVNSIWLVTVHPAAYLLGGFMNGVLLVGFLYALNDDKRAWHDEWAGRAVYYRRRVAPPPLPYRGYHPRPPNGPITASA